MASGSLRDRVGKAFSGVVRDAQAKMERGSTTILCYDTKGYATAIDHKSEQGRKLVSLAEQIMAISGISSYPTQGR